MTPTSAELAAELAAGYPDTRGHALEWDAAYEVCTSGIDWEIRDALESAAAIEAATALPGEPQPEPGKRGTLATLTAALIVAYTNGGHDADLVRACLAAAGQQYGNAWTVRQFQAVTGRFSIRVDGGWEEIGHDFLDDHYPGLPEGWIEDMAQVGRDARRDSELYITLDPDSGDIGGAGGPVYVFQRATNETDDTRE
jgi:hypothetical protein